MATRTQDQPIISEMAELHGVKDRDSFSHGSPNTIVAGYGRHPWFSHELYDDTVSEPTFALGDSEDVEAAKERHYKAVLTPSPQDPAFWHDLPTPEPLSEFISATRIRLKADPLAMIGEIGLDKAFRLAKQWESPALKDQDPERTPGGRQGRVLSPHHICMEHQKTILMAHLSLAGELGRAVSVHGVQVHGLLYDALSSCWKGHERKGRNQRSRMKGAVEPDMGPKPYPPRICLHSFSGKGDAVKQYLKPSIPARIFFSFSMANNLRSEGGWAKAEDAVRMVPDNRLLVESDLHAAGERMDGELEEIYRTICEFKGWGIEEGIKQIADNYREFVFG